MFAENLRPTSGQGCIYAIQGRAAGRSIMSQAPSVAFAVVDSDNRVPASADREAVSLRGTTRGLEISICGSPALAVISARLTELFAEAPGFFAGCHARVAFDGALPSGALACLEEVAERFGLTIVEVGPMTARRPQAPAVPARRAGEPRRSKVAEGTGPIADEAVASAAGEPGSATTELPSLPVEMASGRIAPAEALPEATPAVAAHAEAAPVELVAANTAPYEAVTIEVAADEAALLDVIAAITSGATPTAIPSSAPPSDPAASRAAAIPEVTTVVAPAPRLVIGPVRSGVIVDHPGHVIVIGDVNPCAEVRAEGSIIVLGRMRGVAHAAIGRAAGFIIALSLQPQQLRIGRMVARAADADRPSGGAEIAYANGETIVVERFQGKLPSGLAASM
jgi:septum site-determining protein MinC